MKPVRDKPSASATSVANHTKVFQAGLLLVISFQFNTPVHNIRVTTSNAASAGSMKLAAKIHMANALQTNNISRISLRDNLPSFSSSRLAQRGTSSLILTSGGYSQYASNGIASSSSTPNGRKAINQVPHEISIPTMLFTSASASRLGASADRNIELVIQAALMATHIR